MPNYLSNLAAPEGANRGRRRKGRGVGSGLGKTAGKGQKGQKARHPGNFGKLAFQGGQTPIQRRLPKRGFRNHFAIDVTSVNLAVLGERFAAGTVVDLAALKAAGLVRAGARKVKILGQGEIKRALTFKVDGVSAGAKAKIEKAGGSVQLLDAVLTDTSATGSAV